MTYKTFLLSERVKDMKVSEALRRFRTELGLRQKDVSKVIGIQTKNYQFYEYGRFSPSVESIIKLSKTYEVSTDYLLGLTEEKNLMEEDKLRDIIKRCYEIIYPVVGDKIEEFEN